MTYRIVITSDASGKSVPHHLADATVVFDEVGLKIVGFSIWKPRDSRRGGLSVTGPARPTRKGKDQTGQVDYFDFVRDAVYGNGAVKRLKKEILTVFRAENPALALHATVDEAEADASAEG